MGLPATSHLYEVWNITKRRSIWTRDITILEGDFLPSNNRAIKSIAYIPQENDTSTEIKKTNTIHNVIDTNTEDN